MLIRHYLLSGLLLLAGIVLNAQQWKIVETNGTVQARMDNGFMSCKGKFYLLGGHGIKPVNILDPSTGEWSQGMAPPVEMHHFQAIRIEDEIWVIGAFTGEYLNERPLEHMYIYNTAGDSWRKGAKIPADRLRGSAGVAVYRENIYMIGGTRDLHSDINTRMVDRYDPKSGKWKKLADAPRNRGHFHAGVCNGKIYAAGGSNPSGYNSNGPGEIIPEVDIYDIEKGKWFTLPPDQNLPTPRAACATVSILDHIVVIGGEVPEQVEAFRLVEAYDIDRGAWERWDELETGRCGTQAFMCVGAVFITAGGKDNQGHLADTELEMFSTY